MIFQALTEAAEKGELILQYGAICRFRMRKDGQLTVYEIVVLPEHRNRGLGKAIIKYLIQHRKPKSIVARCPVKLSSNIFWQKMGFNLIETKKEINTWRITLSDSSGAREEINDHQRLQLPLAGGTGPEVTTQ